MTRGQLVRLTAVTNTFFGQRQLQSVSAIEVLDPMLEDPVPVQVSPADVQTDGPQAWPLEGVVVELPDTVTVTEVAPEVGPGDREPTNEFRVDDAVRIDDFLFLIDPLPGVGDEFERIAGVLRYANGNSKIEPRDAQDLERGAVACEPAEEICDEIDNDCDGQIDEGDVCNVEPGDCANWMAGDPPCVTTIYGVRDEMATPDDVEVVIEGQISATRGQGTNFALQVPADHPAYTGPEGSGIWVFGGNADADVAQLARGQVVRLTGTTNTFFGQRQLQGITAVEIIGDGMPLAPTVVAAADVQTDGPMAWPLEGVLVQLEGTVTVTEVEPEAGPGDRAPTQEFRVDEAVRINDFLYLIEPFPGVGDEFDRLAGVLRFANGNSKVEPRDADDLERGFIGEPSELVVEAPAFTTPGSMFNVTVRLDRPTAEAMPLDLNIDPADAIVGPLNAEIPAGQAAVTVTYVAGDLLGEVTVSAADASGNLFDSATIEIVPAAAGGLVINELDYDQAGADEAEFIEIFNTLDVPENVADVFVELVNGNNGEVYARYPLADLGQIPARGLVVIASAAVAAVVPENVPVIPLEGSIQNGAPDGVRIVDGQGVLIDGLAYEGAIEGVGEGNPSPGEVLSVDNSLGRCDDGRDSNDNASDFSEMEPSPGLLNCPAE